MGSDIFGAVHDMADGTPFEPKTQEDPLVYLSMLSQLRVTQNAQTLDLLDRTGR